MWGLLFAGWRRGSHGFVSWMGEARWCPLVRCACGTSRRGSGGSMLFSSVWFFRRNSGHIQAVKTPTVLPSTRTHRQRREMTDWNWFVLWEPQCKDGAQTSSHRSKKGWHSIFKPWRGRNRNLSGEREKKKKDIDVLMLERMEKKKSNYFFEGLWENIRKALFGAHEKIGIIICKYRIC